MRLSTRATFRTVLVVAMGLFVAAYAVILILHGARLSQDITNVLGLLAVWMSAAVCALAVSRVRFQRWEVLLAAAAVTSYAVGLTYYGVVLAPSWWCLGGCPTPTPRAVSGGGPPLKSHETRDNLRDAPDPGLRALTQAQLPFPH